MTPSAKAHGVSSYATYGAAFMPHDLSEDLGPAFRGEYLDRYVAATPQPTMPVFHSVGASDPIEASDVRVRIDDGSAEHAGGMDCAGRV